jgi:hypothetical protein
MKFPFPRGRRTRRLFDFLPTRFANASDGLARHVRPRHRQDRYRAAGRRSVRPSMNMLMMPNLVIASGAATLGKTARTRELVAACVLGVLGAPSAGAAGQIAATVEYEFIPRPAGLASDFGPDERASLRFLTIKTMDGYRMGAALWQPDQKEPADTTLILMAPGDNNYQSPPQSTLGRGLAQKGYAALAIYTRNHDGNIYQSELARPAARPRSRGPNRPCARLPLSGAAGAQPRKPPRTILCSDDVGRGRQGRDFARRICRPSLDRATCSFKTRRITKS